jgi:carbon monoxide dehydrogenase subunit G
MPRAQRTIRIGRPPETVFAFLTNPTNDAMWRSGVKEMSAEGGPGVGRRIHQVVAGPGGRGIAADIEVTAYEAPTRYAFRTVSGPVRPTGEYRLAAEGADATDVSFTLTADVSGWKRFVMGGAVQKSMASEMAALDKAKAMLEGR